MTVLGKNAICKDQPTQYLYQRTSSDVYIHILMLDLKFEAISMTTVQALHTQVCEFVIWDVKTCPFLVKMLCCKDLPTQSWYQRTTSDAYIHILMLDIKFDDISMRTVQDMH